MTDFPTLAGQLLIAMPQLNDPHFENTVTLICEHTEEGAMGVTINRPMDLTHGEVFSGMDGFDDIPETERDQLRHAEPVLTGGPVSPERGFILHSDAGAFEATLQIADDIYLSMSRDAMTAMFREGGPASGVMILGYAGWDATQLEDEMLANSWLTVPASASLVFETPYEARWDSAAAVLGLTRSQLSGPSGHA
ncbi:MAG: YqgE/AlgH family protein [Pseudomonadota bacterium]